MATSREIITHINKLVQKKQQETLNKVCNETQKQAQRSFNRAKPEVPADDPNVMVYQSPTFYVDNATIGRKVICEGNQVLFIEFGAGVHHKLETSTIVVSGNEDVEWASRPKGIVGIGEYGHGFGKDDYWFYKSKTGRGSINSEQVRYNFNKNTYTMITIGIRPVRALYLAIGLSFRKLLGGKL